MKTKITLIAGCSHSAGSEIDGTEDSEFNRNNSFGSVLSNMLDRKPVNISMNGATNATIARSVLNWFNTEYDEDTMDVVVLIGWTEPTRLEVPWHHLKWYEESNTSADWFDKTANLFNRVIFGWDGGTPEEKKVFNYFHRFISDYPSMVETLSANLVLQLQYFFKSKNIKYLMCNTLYMFTSDDEAIETLVNLIDTNHYYNPRCTQDEAFYWKYRHMGYINEKATYWHHGTEPHRLFAEELYNFAKENKCLDS